MILPGYAFYKSAYNGKDIVEDDFPRLINRAGAYLDNLLSADVSDEEYKSAACAVAEAWLVNEQGGDVASQSVGSWSKSYAQRAPKSDEKRLYDAAALYLGQYLSVRWV